MKRYLAMLGIVTLLALPAIATAETNDQHVSVQQTANAERLAELLARKGIITQQELVEVSTPDTAEPANGVIHQESDSSWVRPYAGDERSYHGE